MRKAMMPFLCLVVVQILWVQTARASCDNSAITGSYGWSASGFGNNGMPEAPVPGGASLPAALQGDITFDGNGNITHGTQRVQAGGTVVPTFTFLGSYSVNADCSGTVNRAFTQGFHVLWSIEVVNGGAEILFLYREPGITIQGTMVRR